MRWIAEHPEHGPDSTRRRGSRKNSPKPQTGCQQCRGRRIKCDEIHPICSQCAKYDIKCSYASEETTSSSATPERLLDENDQYQSMILRILWDTDVPRRDADDAIYQQADNREILEHFIRYKDELWLGTPVIQQIIQTYAARWSCNAPYLMYAIMAGSAAHLSYCSSQPGKYDVAQTVHYTLALQSFAAQLSKPITRENMDALIACSIVHGPLAFWRQDYEDTDEMPFRWLRTIRGVPAILASIPDKSWIEQSVWYKYTLQAGGNNGENPLPEDPTIVPWARHVIERLEELCEISIRDSDSRSVYTAPLRHLSKLLRMNDHHNYSSATLRFNGHLSVEFVDMLEGGDTRALLIFCYWYGLMCNVKQWWTEKHALRGCRRLCESLAHCKDPRVQDLLEWPRIQAGMV